MGYICVTRNGLSLVYRLYTLPLIVMHYSGNVKDNYWTASFPPQILEGNIWLGLYRKN